MQQKKTKQNKKKTLFKSKRTLILNNYPRIIVVLIKKKSIKCNFD